MRKRNLWVILILTVCVSAMLVTGCAKKPVQKAVITGEEPPAVEQQVPLEDQAAKEQAARERALKEQTLKEQALKEQAAKEEAAKELVPTAKEEFKLEDIHFDFDKFNLKPEVRKILEQHTDWLLKHENCSLVIEGHCDERGTTEYNLALGERRAAAAAKYLTDLGIDETRIETISYGEERPLDPGHNEEAWAKNRRAHFVVIPKKAAP
ncbi:MAG: peptidoglycan-associated lipoprotein Pal [Syntrophales bacterium]|nr:peptidoglycan-associated lipoprotein Pal [Syntrophales bacterium]